MSKLILSLEMEIGNGIGKWNISRFAPKNNYYPIRTNHHLHRKTRSASAPQSDPEYAQENDLTPAGAMHRKTGKRKSTDMHQKTGSAAPIYMHQKTRSRHFDENDNYNAISLCNIPY